MLMSYTIRNVKGRKYLNPCFLFYCMALFIVYIYIKIQFVKFVFYKHIYTSIYSFLLLTRSLVFGYTYILSYTISVTDITNILNFSNPYAQIIIH
jgi:hypothetical protein